MSNAIIFYYPYPDSPYDVVVTADSYSVYIGQLWDLAKKEEPGLDDHIGKARCTFFMVCSSFLYTIGGVFHIFSNPPTFFSPPPPPCSLPTQNGFRSTPINPPRSTASISSPISFPLPPPLSAAFF